MFNDLIGKLFEDGGRGPDGFDCWGLSIEVFRRYGIALPDYKICCEDASRIDGQIKDAQPRWTKFDGPLPVPCLVVMRFNSPVFCNHTGVYIGEGKFIHTRERIGVNIDSIESPAWKHRIEGFYIPREAEIG